MALSNPATTRPDPTRGKLWDEEPGGDPTVSLRNMSKVVAGDYGNVTFKR